MRAIIGVTKKPMAATAAVPENVTAKFCANDPRCRRACTLRLTTL